MPAEEIIFFLRVLPRLARINRNPAVPSEVEFSPAMIALNLAFAAFFRQRKSYLESRGYTYAATEPDEDLVKVCAVSALPIEGIKNIAAPPAFAALVVLHRRESVLVNRTRFFKVGLLASGHFHSPFANLICDRNQLVWLQEGLNRRVERPCGYVAHSGKIFAKILRAAYLEVHLKTCRPGPGIIN